MKKLLLIAVCLIALASSASAIYNVIGATTGGGDSGVFPGSGDQPMYLSGGENDVKAIGEPGNGGMYLTGAGVDGSVYLSGGSSGCAYTSGGKDETVKMWGGDDPTEGECDNTGIMEWI